MRVPPTDEQFWITDQHGRRKTNVDFLREHFIREGRLTETQALTILRQATDMLTSEPNILRVKSPVTGMLTLHLSSLLVVERCIVVGDIHGQYVSDHYVVFTRYLDVDFIVRSPENI